MNNWTVIINFSIGVAGLSLSILGLIMSIISRPVEKAIRVHLSGIFLVMAFILFLAVFFWPLSL